METNPENQNSSINDSSFYFDDDTTFKNSHSTVNSLSVTNIVSKNKQLSSENIKLKETIKDLQARLELSESKYKQNSENMSDELQNAKNETMETKKNLINTVKNLELKLDEQTKVNSKLEKENQNLKSQIDSFLHSVELRSKKQVSTLIQASQLYDDLFSFSESTSDKIKYLENENSSLLDQISETSGLMKNKEEEASKLKKKLKKAAKQMSQSQIGSEEFQKLTKLHEKEMKEAQSIISEQNDQINQMQKRINQTETDFVNNNFDLNQPPKNSGNYVSAEVYETNVSILQNKIQSAEQLLNNKEEAISSLQDTIYNLKEKCDDFSHQLQEANLTISTNDENYKLLKEKSKQSKQTIQKLRDDLSTKEKELAEYSTTIRELQLKINELETEKQKALNINPAPINSRENDDQPKESLLQYKEKIKLYDNRINELESLFENQSKEIAELFEQRNSYISKMIQFDQLLTKTEALDKELSKSNKLLTDENNLLKSEAKVKSEREKDVFNRAIDECLEIIPKEAAFSLQQNDLDIINNNNNSNYYGKTLKDFVQTLVLYNEKSINEVQLEVDKNKSDDTKKTNVALLEHLQNSCKILKSFANSNSTIINSFQFSTSNDNSDKNNQFYNEIDSNPRTFLLATCARLDKFIQNQKINLPIDEFRPSIFEPRELNDPQKVAEVFLDFVEPESFEKSPIAELFTLFMCVCQVNQILIKNIDENKVVLQQAIRSSQNESAYFKQLSELEKWRNKQTELNEKLKPFLVNFIERENKDQSPKTEFYDFDELVEKVLTVFEHCNGELPVTDQTADLIQKIDDLEKQVDILQKEIEHSHRKQEEDRQLFCKKANKIVTQVQRRLEANNKHHEDEKSQLASQLDETKKLLETSKASYESMINKAQKKLAKREEMINTLRTENENLSQRTVTIQEMLSQSKSQIDSDTDVIHGLQKELDETRKQLELAMNQKKLYKKKLEEVEENNMNILSSLRQRSEELNNKYENSIANLEKELNSARDALEQTRSEMAEIELKKQELSLTNAKLKMLERTASLKLIAANEALDREKQASEMRQKSIALALKAESDANSAENDKIITQAIELFNRIIIEEFDLSPTSNLMLEKNLKSDSNLDDENFDASNDNIVEINNKDSLLAVMSEVSDNLDTRQAQQFAINDALRLRRLLKLNSSASLIDAFKSLEEESQKLKQEAENMKTKSLNTEANSLRIIRDNQKLERAASELAEWTNWSRIMLRHLSDVASQRLNQTAKETRFILEEALLASLNQKSIRKKVDILRFEKKLLLSQKPLVVKTNAQLRVREPIRSITPLIIAFNFSRRIQDMSGKLPFKFNTP